jgi:hypothetical protein
LPVSMGLVILLAAALPAIAKVEVDFNPNLNFSQFKTYAYIGRCLACSDVAVESELINDRVHRALRRGLTTKGLRECSRNESPDLVVRYWANSQVQVNVAATGNWGPYAPYLGTYWGLLYDTIRPSRLRIRRKSGRTRSANRNKRNERPERRALQGSRDGGGNQSWTILAVLQ